MKEKGRGDCSHSVFALLFVVSRNVNIKETDGVVEQKKEEEEEEIL